MIVPVILAGGSGSRLWPLSRSAYPKQLLPLINHQTLLQNTILRAQFACDNSTPLIICNHEYRFLVAEQLQEIGLKNHSLILEPFGKNTAPAAAIAALYLVAQNDPILLVLPADHVIKDIEHFRSAVKIGTHYAKIGKLVTFGITPSYPETGYGYIKTGDSLDENIAYSVSQFVEKPNLETAKTYLASGKYYWNSGIFMFRASQFLAELELYQPNILQACRHSINGMTQDLDFLRIHKDSFEDCPSDSIDYAVMEKTQRSILIPLNTDWNDIGSWSALLEVQESDSQDNVIQGDVVTHEVSRSYLRAENRMLAVIGVTDHIIIETADAVLVAHKNKCQHVKEIVEHLKNQQRPEAESHRKVYRPWGYYETIEKGDRFQVKRITVKPGASLSLQMHRQRSEHWIIVKGVAEVICGDKIFTIKENESTYIPIGTKHRLSNPGPDHLELIEVQSGNYLGEDDIVRYEDAYGRMETEII